MSLGTISCQSVSAHTYLKRQGLGCGNSAKVLCQTPASSLGGEHNWFGIDSSKPFCNGHHVLHVQGQWGEEVICTLQLLFFLGDYFDPGYFLPAHTCNPTPIKLICMHETWAPLADVRQLQSLFFVVWFLHSSSLRHWHCSMADPDSILGPCFCTFSPHLWKSAGSKWDGWGDT